MKVTKPFLILQLRPETETSDSEFAAILKYGELNEWDTSRYRIEQSGIPDINLDDYSAVIVGGSPFDISTPAAKKSAIQNKLESDFQHLLDEIVPRDFPFLGACSGNGLLGSYLHARISGKYAEPVGITQVKLTTAGKKDVLLQGFPEQFPVLLGHKEACDTTPKGAVLLISSKACPVQMFRVGNNVYATQFHPEGDKEGFCLRIEVYKHHGYFQPDEALRIAAAVSREPTPFAQKILKRFVARYAR